MVMKPKKKVVANKPIVDNRVKININRNDRKIIINNDNDIKAEVNINYVIKPNIDSVEANPIKRRMLPVGSKNERKEKLLDIPRRPWWKSR